MLKAMPKAMLMLKATLKTMLKAKLNTMLKQAEIIPKAIRFRHSSSRNQAREAKNSQNGDFSPYAAIFMRNS